MRIRTRNDFDEKSGAFFEVGYELLSLAMKQPRLAGRLVLRPAIDLSAYTCRAIIDWFELEITIGKPMQQQHIGDIAERVLVRRPWVEPIMPGPGGVTNSFRIRVQEPKLDHIRRMLAEIDSSKAGIETAVLGRMEVSLDFYATDHQELSRAKLYAIIARHLAFDLLNISNSARRPRSYGSTRRTLSLVKTFSRDRARMLQALEDAASDHPPALSSTFYIGRQGDPDVMIRLQHKVTDNRNPQAGTFDELIDEKRRVRLEVTLGETAMKGFGLSTPDDLSSFRFTRLQSKCFRFRLPTFAPLTATPGTTMEHVARYREKARLRKFKASGMIGLDALDQGRVALAMDRRGEVRLKINSLGKRVKRSTRMPAPTDLSIAWDEIMRKVEQALRHLGERV